MKQRGFGSFTTYNSPPTCALNERPGVYVYSRFTHGHIGVPATMILFNELMRHFPHDQFPCRTSSKRPRYENQCAIRLSVALVGADPHFLDDYPGNKCPHGHARGARGLARYLRLKLAEPERPNTRNDILGQGILFYRRTEMNHIDVWSSWVCLPRYGHGDCCTMSSTYADALELWFWPLRG